LIECATTVEFLTRSFTQFLAQQFSLRSQGSNPAPPKPKFHTETPAKSTFGGAFVFAGESLVNKINDLHQRLKAWGCKTATS
jgi:hypothetical protein